SGTLKRQMASDGAQARSTFGGSRSRSGELSNDLPPGSFFDFGPDVNSSFSSCRHLKFRNLIAHDFAAASEEFDQELELSMGVAREIPGHSTLQRLEMGQDATRQCG